MSSPGLRGLTQLALVAALVAACAGQASLNTYAVNWTAVPIASTQPKDLTANCICDVTLNACDPSCCCDADCPYSVTNLTSAEGRCLPEGPPDQTLDFCVASSSVQKVNLPSNSDYYYTVIQAADSKFINQLLCVQSSTNPNVGMTYPDPTAGNYGNNANYAGCPAIQYNAVPGATYFANSPVFVRGGTLTGTYSRPLTLPYPAFSRACVDNFQPGFLIPLPPNQRAIFSECDRDISGLGISEFSDICDQRAGPWSVLQYTDLIYQASPTVSSNPAIAVTSMQLLFQYPNGTLVDISTTGPVAPTYDAGVGACRNVLRYVNMTFVYSNSTVSTTSPPGYQLNQVQMSFILSDISYDDQVFQQFSRADFVESYSASPPMTQQLSGNPGYLIGFPVLTGVQVTGSDPTVDPNTPLTAISRFTSGFPLPVGNPALNGMCSGQAMGTVNFGMNTTATCNVPLNLTGLKAACDASKNATHLLASFLDGFYAQLSANEVWVGIWGNSDSNAVPQWIPVTQSNNNFANLIFVDGDNTCGNMVVGYDIQVLYGVAFASNNLQRKVLYFNVCYRTSPWQYPPGLATSAPDTLVNFQMTSTVSFIPLPQQAQQVTKPHPPLAIPLSEEIFYPFVTSGATRAAAPAAIGGLAALVALALLVNVAAAALSSMR